MKIEDFKIVDVHCHVFPHKLAAAAANNIGAYYSLPVNGDGTLETMMKMSEDVNMYRYVVSSAATKATNVCHANDFIYSCTKQDEKIVGLGTTHADFTDNEAEFERIVSMGLRGIKLHTDFQRFDIDDPKMDEAYRLCEKYRLPVLFHVGDPKSDFSRADKLYNVIDRFPDLIVVAAHMGGYTTAELMKKYLLGKDIYFDCSEWHNFMSKEELCEYIRIQGVDRILFGSDYPLYPASWCARQLIDSGLDADELEKIFYTNAVRLFKL